MTAIRVELELEDGSFTSRLIHAGEGVDQFTRNVGQGITSISRMEKESAGLLSTVRDLTVTLAVAGHAIHNLEAVTTGWAGEIIHINAEVERMKALLVSLSTAADPVKEATDTVAQLRDVAKSTPFSLQAIHDTFIRLKTTGIDPMNGSMRSLTDAVAAFGGNDQTLHRASLAIQEMASKGVVQMKELRNQLGAAIPNSLPLLARAMGVSYEELMSDIHTGTVDAKAAIAALEGEFERTFGGAGQRQMQTFNGLVSQIQVNMQKLAIDFVGREGVEGGYFETVKKQAADLNAFLEGTTAQGAASMLGDGLVKVITTLRSAIEMAVQFKDEIGAAGEALAVAFVAKAALAGVASLIGQFRTMQKEVTMIGVAWEAMAEKQRVASLLNSTTMMGAPMMSGYAAAATSAGAAIEMIGVGISTVVPWLLVLGPALAAAAEYFGLFHDKNVEAYDSLVRFGAKTEEEAKKADVYLDTLNKRVEGMERLRLAHENWLAALKRGEDAGYEPAEGPDDESYKKAVAERDAVAAKVPKLVDQGLGAESKAFVREQIEALQEVFRAYRSQYNKEATDSGRIYDQAFKDLNAKHKDTAALTKGYQEEERQRNLRLYDEQEEGINKVLAKAKELQSSLAPKDRREGHDLEDAANAQLVDVQRQRRAELARPMGVSLDAKVIDPEKLYAKGKEELDRMQDKINGLTAGLEGLDPKVYELQSLLERGFKFGDIGVDRVRELIDAMVRAKGEADALSEAMKGQQKFDNDLRSLNENLDERLFKAQHGTLGDAEQLQLKLKDGFYKGLGPDEERVKSLVRNMEDARFKTLQLQDAAGVAGNAIATAMGGPAKSAVQTLTEQVTALGGALSGMKMPNLQLPAMGAFTLGQGSGDYYDKLIKRESGGRADAGVAEGARAQGLGQFIPSTWESFLSATHADLKGRDDLRADPALSREAIAWYTSQNAQKLTQQGFQPSDDHLYLAHFLGPGGASRVLGGDAGTQFASDPYFNKAVGANSFLGSMSYGDLQKQIASQFGTAFTAMQASASAAAPKGVKALDDANARAESGLAAAAEKEKLVVGAEQKAALEKELNKLTETIGKANVQLDDKRKNYAQVVDLIHGGTLGSKDEKDPAYKDLLSKADAADAAEKLKDDNSKARSTADTAIKDTERLIRENQARQDLLWASIKDGSRQSLGANSELLREKGAASSREANVDKAYGTDSDQAKTQRDQDAQVLAGLRNEEIAKDIDGLQKKTAAVRESLMTQEDAQKEAHDREIARMQKELDAFTGTEQQKAALSKIVSDNIAANDAKRAGATPLAKEMKEWGDVTKNAQQMTANWVNSTTDAIATMVTTGKTNWKSLTTSMESDLVKMALHGAIGGLGSGMKGGAASGGGGLLSGIASMFGGGIGPAFAGGTNDFQTGGMALVGEKGPEILNLPAHGQVIPNDVLSQMASKSMANDQMSTAQITGGDTHNHIQIAPVLQASGGTQAQNADLAAQMSKHVEDAARRVFADESRKQMRPGGLFDGTNFTR